MYAFKSIYGFNTEACIQNALVQKISEAQKPQKLLNARLINNVWIKRNLADIIESARFFLCP
jgi:hypothetical protein